MSIFGIKIALAYVILGLAVAVIGGTIPIAEALLAATKEAAAQTGIEDGIEYVADMERIMNYGVMSIPARMIDGKAMSTGKVLKAKDIVKLLYKLDISD